MGKVWVSFCIKYTICKTDYLQSIQMLSSMLSKLYNMLYSVDFAGKVAYNKFDEQKPQGFQGIGFRAGPLFFCNFLYCNIMQNNISLNKIMYF